jgi:glycosyltransferase involved in cell wall biosynthesis
LRIFLEITDLVEFLNTADVLHGVQNVTHQLILALRASPGARLIGFHPLYGRAFCVDVAQVPQEIFAEPKNFKSFFGLDGRRPIKSPSAIRSRHAGRPARQLFEHAKRRVRQELRAFARPAAPLALHAGVQGFGITGGDLVIVPGLNVWYPEHNRELGMHVRAQGGRLVVVVHDLGPMTAAQYFPASYQEAFREWTKSLFPYADLFVADSQHTASEMARIDPALRRDTPCVVNPLAHEFPQGAAGVRPPVSQFIERDYVLHVGRIEPRKNLVGLVTVWSRLADELGPALPLLVLAGRKNYPDGSFDAAIRGLGPVANHIRFATDVSSEKLARLYGGCRFAVYPSFFEGWGLPIGEAACFGKVTAASNAASIPEVVGDLAVYFDPANLDNMACVLRRLISDRDYLARLEAKLKCRFHPRSWAECAARLIAIARQ